MTKYRSATTGRFTDSPATKMKKIYSELYRAFDHFNKVFTGNNLPKPVITIQESGRKNAYGWFGNSFWFDREMKEGVPEINLSAEYLARGKDGILETLLHEMAHFYNAINNIKDCSSGQYHNKHFKKAAEMFGLKVERSKTRGYSSTYLTDASIAAINSLKINESLFTGIKRKTIRANREKKYISLVVDASMIDTINRGMQRYGVSQKSFVETAILQAVNV